MQTLYDKVENIPFQNIGLNQDRRVLCLNAGRNRVITPALKLFQKLGYPTPCPQDLWRTTILAGESISIVVKLRRKVAESSKSIFMSSVAYMNDIFRISTVMNERELTILLPGQFPFSAGVVFN